MVPTYLVMTSLQEMPSTVCGMSTFYLVTVIGITDTQQTKIPKSSFSQFSSMQQSKIYADFTAIHYNL